MYPDENVPHIFCVQERTNCVYIVCSSFGSAVFTTFQFTNGRLKYTPHSMGFSLSRSVCVRAYVCVLSILKPISKCIQTFWAR